MIGTGIDSFHIRCLFLRGGFHCQQANTADGWCRIRSNGGQRFGIFTGQAKIKFHDGGSPVKCFSQAGVESFNQAFSDFIHQQNLQQ